MTLWAFAAAVASVVPATPWASPIILAAPAVLLAFHYRAKGNFAGALVIRWMVGAGLALLMAAAIAPGRLAPGVPGGTVLASRVAQWIGGSGPAPVGPLEIFVSAGALIVAAAVGRMPAAFGVAAILLARFIVVVSTTYAMSDNLIAATLVAAPPWHAALIAFVILALPALPGHWSGAQKRAAGMSDRPLITLRPALWALFLSLFARVVLAAPWGRLARAMLH